jgi:hypothetical protein
MVGKYASKQVVLMASAVLAVVATAAWLVVRQSERVNDPTSAPLASDSLQTEASSSTPVFGDSLPSSGAISDRRDLPIKYDALKERAELGAPSDALTLYSVLQRCHAALTSPSNQDEVEALQAAGVDVKAVLQRQAEQLESCSKVPTADVADRGKWLTAAAEAGLVEAQLIYATDVESILGVRDIASADPLTSEHYRRRSLNFLENLAQQGDINALQMLASAHDPGGFAGENPVASLGLRMVANRLNPNPYSSQVIDSLSGRLSASEQRAAELYARRLFETCCTTIKE